MKPEVSLLRKSNKIYDTSSQANVGVGAQRATIWNSRCYATTDSVNSSGPHHCMSINSADDVRKLQIALCQQIQLLVWMEKFSATPFHLKRNKQLEQHCIC